MWNLIRKELELQRKGFAALIGLVFGLGLLAWLSSGNAAMVALTTAIPMMATVAVIAVMLAHSFSSEWQQNTHYLLLALPIRPVTIALSKYLAFMTAGLGVLMAFSFWVLVTSPDSLEIATTLPGSPKDILWRLFAFYFLCLLHLLLGIVVFLQGCTVGRQRYRGLIARTLFVACIVLFMILAVPITSLMDSLGYFEIDVNSPTVSLTELSYYPAFFLYAAGAGSLFLILGLWLFDRRMDL